MRTTIRLDPHLLARAREVAAASDKTLSAVIEDAVRQSLSMRATRQVDVMGKLPTFRGIGLHPGVNLDNSAALLELMERERD